jgi:hypothetical protein
MVAGPRFTLVKPYGGAAQLTPEVSFCRDSCSLFKMIQSASVDRVTTTGECRGLSLLFP